jgi:cytochrome c oxidase subunit 3
MALATMSKTKRIHPQKFALWVGLVGVVMLFAALTSAYIVRKSAGNWYLFPMPTAFYYSTAAILASSLALHASYKAYLGGKHQLFKILLYTGFALGWAFVSLQYLGWQNLQQWEVFIHTNQSSSFFYLITGVHVLHVLGGIAALTVLIVHTIRKRYDPLEIGLDEMLFERSATILAKRQLRLELIFTYWHFVDALWIYLLVFLSIQ